MFKRPLAFLFFLLVGSACLAQEPTPAEPATANTAAALLSSLKFQDGSVTIDAANAALNLGDRYQFLGASDTRRVLEDLWGNPPDDSVLGMLVPRGVDLAHEDSWAAVITWQGDGYVSDEDASEINYDELLTQMQEDTAASNAARAEAGYGTLELLGWAEAPTYDHASKRLYWGKKLSFQGSTEPTLNYDIRVLGRYGVLSMNVIASHSALAKIHDELPEIANAASFLPGSTYAEFTPGTDRMAEYGVAALIGGGLAAKSGLLGKLLALLLAAKKFVILIAIAVFGGVRALLNRKKASA